MKQTRNYFATVTLSLSVLFVVVFVFFIYTFLHEGGHALAGGLFGQSLTEFNVNFWDFSAHVGMAGGELSQAQLAMRSLAGASLPFLVWVVLISLVPRRASFTLETLKLISSMAVVNTLLAWIVLPVLFLWGKAPADDVTSFLLYSQIPPPVLTLAAIILYAGGWSLFLAKINGMRNEFRLFGASDRETLLDGTQKTIPVLAGIMMGCAVLVFTLSGAAAKNPLDRFSPPQDFASVAQIDLAAQAYSGMTLTRFSLDKPGYVGIFVAVHNINTSYIDLSVTGPDGYRSVVLHGEGYSAAVDGGLWEENLPPGVYQVVLNSHQSPGTVSVYLKTR